MKYIRLIASLFRSAVTPRSKDKDLARQEYILNILLLSAIVLSFILTLSSYTVKIIDVYIRKLTVDSSPEIAFYAFLFFLLCYYISRKGKIYVVAYTLLATYFLVATYTGFRWGISVPQALLTYALVIVMAGVLISSRSAFILTTICLITIFTLTYIQLENIVPVSTSWTEVPPHMGDALVYSVTLFVIAVVAWLSNREMEKALIRARRSERELRKQRDNLEITVEERTKALRLAQMEKIAQLERFAEFGRISSGLFHDLSGPLNLVSLNLDRLNKHKGKNDKEQIEKSAVLLSRAMVGIKRLEFFVNAARRQVQYQETNQLFSLRDEIHKVIQVLNYHAKEKQVSIVFNVDADKRTYGNPIKFSQIITNLLNNAIDAYEDIPKGTDKHTVVVEMKKRKNASEITVHDSGVGIIEPHLPLIFQPFFTTKHSDKGMGIGLSICKDIVEKDFHGKITVSSKPNAGTTFNLTFPLTEKAGLKKI